MKEVGLRFRAQRASGPRRTLGLESSKTSRTFRQWPARLCRMVSRISLLSSVLLLAVGSQGQTNCEEGNGLLDFSPPKTMTVPDVIKKFGVAEDEAKRARLH